MAQLSGSVELASTSREYARLLMKPKLTADMFGCRHDDWALAFARWNVIYVWALLAVSLLFWLLHVLGLFLRFALVSIAISVLFTLLDILLFLLLNWTSWYCVVKRLGFCGRVGYLAWALLYVCLNIGRLGAVWSGGVSYWIYLLMLFPAGYMVLSLIQLFRGVGGRGTRVVAAHPLKQPEKGSLSTDRPA